MRDGQSLSGSGISRGIVVDSGIDDKMVSPVSGLMALRQRPHGKPVMLQEWHRLSFLHWKVDVEAVQKTLPEGLTVDTFEGEAYVGLVPFTMQDIRFVWSPTVPGLSDFHETNVRTYVKDRYGRPGVWFYSLDAANPVGAFLGRRWFGLPYHFSNMDIDGTDPHAYFCKRRSVKEAAEYSVTVEFPKDVVFDYAVEGSLEFWLAERYLLYALKRGRLYSGRVHHKPYLLGRSLADVRVKSLPELGQFGVDMAAPELVHFSPGVSVEVFRLMRVPGQ